MANLEIWATQDDVTLGEKLTLGAKVCEANPGSLVTVVIESGSRQWPGTIHVNSHGTGGCVSTDVVLEGEPGRVTSSVLVGTAVTTSAIDVFPIAKMTVRVHG